MRVVVPYTTLDPLAEAALNTHATGWEGFYVGHTNTAYFELLALLWSFGEDFAVVEHDNEIHEHVIPQFAACPQPWCTFPYPGGAWNQTGDTLLYESLGCTRFRTELLATTPAAMTEVGRISDGDGLAARDWRRLDVLLLGQLRQAGFEPHAHTPPIRHHHRYPDGCACGANHDEAR